MAEEDYEDLFYSFIDENNVSEAIEILENINGAKVTFVDQKYSDGLNDCEDEYLMMSSYDVTFPDGTSFYVRFFYGNNTGIITYVEF